MVSGTRVPTSDPITSHNGTTNSWLEVKCVGTVSNRSALGAKVRVRATIRGKALWLTHEISPPAGYNTIPLVAHFGLGDAAKVELLRIEWPSGIVQEIPSVQANQILTVTEPPRLRVSVLAGTTEFAIKGGLGSTYQIQTSTDLSAWSSLTSLTITNASGWSTFADPAGLAASRKFYRAIAR
jgi:hypothetical protein